MAAHLAPHLTGARPESRSVRVRTHLLLVMGFLLSPGNATDFDPKKCEWSSQCNYLAGEYCDNGTCTCFNSCRYSISTAPIKCTEDVECAQLISFSHCVQQTCICLPRYRPMVFGRACELIPESSSTNSPLIDRPMPPYRPAGETDYSGVVKMALGAAIVMLAGVILALVWNLYRERRRARRALGSHAASSRTTRQPRTNRRTTRSNNGNVARQDNPPRYDDVFFITASETGCRRHEKPPSYEEALRDQRVPTVSPPAYLNLGFNGDHPATAGYYHAVPTTITSPSRETSPQINASADARAADRTLAETNTLNVTSIVNRLRRDDNDPSATRPIVPTSTLRRTKSGRAPEDICPVQCENLVASVHRSHSNPTTRSDLSDARVTLEPLANVTSVDNATTTTPSITVDDSSLDQSVISTALGSQNKNDDVTSATSISIERVVEDCDPSSPTDVSTC